MLERHMANHNIYIVDISIKEYETKQKRSYDYRTTWSITVGICSRHRHTAILRW